MEMLRTSQVNHNLKWSRYKNILVASCTHLVPFAILETNGLLTLVMFIPKRYKEFLLRHEEQDLFFHLTFEKSFEVHLYL